MSWFDAAIVIFFGWWLLSTVASQIPRAPWRGPRFSPGSLLDTRSPFVLLGLTPVFTLFSQVGASYHVFYRDLTVGRRASPWRELTFGRPRRRSDALWNPWARHQVIAWQLAAALARCCELAGARSEAIVISVPYLQILEIVCGRPRSPDTFLRQFLVLESFGWIPTRPPRVVLRSACHRV